MADSSLLRRTQTALHFGVYAAFLAAISAPGLGMAFGKGSFDAALENRLPEPLPRLSWQTLSQFPARFEQWFSDRFVFRRELIRLTSLAKIAIGVSPSARVLLGKDGWLYYAGENSVPQYRRVSGFSKRKLRAFGDVFETRRAWLAARGVRYLLVIPPNKEVVYPESMPAALRRADRPSRLDQLFEYLRTETGVTAVDLRGGLMRERERRLLYHRTDTHWNDAGAFVAYRGVAERLSAWFPAIAPIADDALAETRLSASGGDLSGMLALRAELPESEYIVLKLRNPRAKALDPGLAVAPETAAHRWPRAFEVSDPALPSAVFIRDSFLNGVEPFLVENFRRVVSVSPDQFPAELIVRERPDVVVDEIIERYLMLPPPLNPPGLGAVKQWDDLSRQPVVSHDPGTRILGLPDAMSFDANDVTLAEGGYFVPTGPDPYLWRSVAPFQAAERQTFEIRLVAEPAAGGAQSQDWAQFFFAGEGPFTEQRALSFPIFVDGKPHDYRVVPSLSGRWDGAIDRVRLDFPDQPGARYRVVAMSIATP